MVRRVPVKLTRGEVVLSPQATAMYRDRLEEMNRIGLQARNMGGVAVYRQAGGALGNHPLAGVQGTGGQTPAQTEAQQQPSFLQQQFNPTGNPDALGQLGKSVSLAAIGDLKGAAGAFDQTANQAHTAKTLADKAALKVANEKMLKAAKAGILELNKGAGKVLNFALTPKVRNAVKLSVGAYARATNLREGFNLSEQEEQQLAQLTNAYFTANDVAALDSYSRLMNEIYTMYVQGRKQLQGQGQITEKESALIYEQVASLSRPADAVAASLQRLIDVVSEELGVPTEKIPYTRIPFASIDDSTLDAYLPKFVGDTVDKVEEVVGGAAESVTDKVGGVADKVKTLIARPNKTFSDDEDPYTPETITSVGERTGDEELDNQNIYPKKDKKAEEVKMPITTKARGKKAQLKWLRKQDPKATIVWRDVTGTVAQLIEYLESKED